MNLEDLLWWQWVGIIYIIIGLIVAYTGYNEYKLHHNSNSWKAELLGLVTVALIWPVFIYRAIKDVLRGNVS